MATDFRTQLVTVPRGTGRRNIASSVTFGSRVNRAAVALNGYNMDYTREDHNINTVEVATDVVNISGNTVNFKVECLYGDKNFDDLYEGYITALIIADVA
jgi:hypothetical protein